MHYKGGFKRRLDKTWLPFREAQFAVNMYDVENGTATMNFDARCQNSEEGVCIASGANAKGCTGTNCIFEQLDCGIQPQKRPISILAIETENDLVTWRIGKESPPQFRWKVKVDDEEVGSGDGEHIRGFRLCRRLSEQVNNDKQKVSLEVEDIAGNCCSLST